MKKRLLCPHLPKSGTPALLSENEAHHAIRVLRLRDGETVEAIDGKGNKSFVTLRIRGGSPRLEYKEMDESLGRTRDTGSILPIVLEMAVLKGDAMEWVVEKAVELGVQELVPVLTEYTVVQMKSKGPDSFRERWQKISDQALKQCGRLTRMEVKIPIALKELLTQSAQSLASDKKQKMIRLWCDETGQLEAPYLMDWLNHHFNSLSPEEYPQVRILVGPEGGWSASEREILLNETASSPIYRIDLGARVLRAETAAIFGMSVVTAHLSQTNTQLS
jgi:16S rRNA (uracil1498-N3)-methyltransferase